MTTSEERAPTGKLFFGIGETSLTDSLRDDLRTAFD